MKTLAVLIGVTALYVATGPALVHQPWDSLDYARACEAWRPGNIRGNHPLGHVVLCGSYQVAAAAGYSGRALSVVAVTNALIAAATLLLFFRMLLLAGIARRQAVAWSVVLGGSFGFWISAGTADIYLVSLLTLLWGWGGLLRALDQPATWRWAMAGLGVGVAVVAHQFNGPLLVAAFVALFVQSRLDGRSILFRHAALLGVVSTMAVVIGYLALGAMATGSTDVGVITHWVIGYGVDETYGRSFTLFGQLQAMYTASATVLHATRSPVIEVVRFLVLQALAATFIAGLCALPWSVGRLKATGVSAVAQLAIGAPLVWWWAPDHVGKWWLLMLPAAVVTQAHGVEMLRRRWPVWQWGAPALGVLVLFFTLLVTVREMRPPDHEFNQTMMLWENHTGPDDVLVESDLTAHLLFWTRRPGTLVLTRVIRPRPHDPDPFGRLRELIETAVRDGRSVWYSDGSEERLSERTLALSGVTRQDVAEFFAGYDRSEPVFEFRPREGRPARTVYRLQVPATSASSR